MVAEQLTAAIVVEDTIFNLAHVGGPAIGGVLIGTVGLAGAYAVDAGPFAFSLAALGASSLEPLYGGEAEVADGLAGLPADGPAFHVWCLT